MSVIESTLAAMKLRPDAAQRILKRESALYVVLKLSGGHQQRLKKIHG
jgi:hypothetical protein